MKISPMSVELVDSMGSDNSVVNAARVSFSKEASKFTDEQNQKLLVYLAKHNHWSPFAHAFLSFRIKAPIFVARQLVKHQVGLAWNEESRRYIDSEPEFWLPSDDGWRGRPINAKQGSDGSIDYRGLMMEDQVLDVDWFPKDVTELCFSYYEFLLRKGVAPEQARMVLPLNTHTEWIWSGSLMAFARVCKLRLDAHAQAETREIASSIDKLIPDAFTYSWKALLER